MVERPPAGLVVRQQEVSLVPRPAGAAGGEEQLVVVHPVNFLGLGDVVRTLANLDLFRLKRVSMKINQV